MFKVWFQILKNTTSVIVNTTQKIDQNFKVEKGCQLLSLGGQCDPFPARIDAEGLGGGKGTIQASYTSEVQLHGSGMHYLPKFRGIPFFYKFYERF